MQPKKEIIYYSIDIELFRGSVKKQNLLGILGIAAIFMAENAFFIVNGTEANKITNTYKTLDISYLNSKGDLTFSATV